MMLRANILLENMEAFSVFKVAQYFRIPSIAILCVSNIVGENAHQQWLDNQILVQHTLTDFIANHYNK